MKRISLFFIIVVLFYACTQEIRLDEPQNNIQNVKEDIYSGKNFSILEEELGITELTDPFTSASLEDLQKTYQNLPQKITKFTDNSKHLETLQHNLIVSMVLYQGLLENSETSEITYYASEFNRLGAEHKDVAGAFNHYLESQKMSLNLINIDNNSKDFNYQTYLELRQDIINMKNN